MRPAAARAVAASVGVREPRPGRVRVVSCVESHASSIGGVSAWSERMERAFASHPYLGIDWHTLFIGPDLAPATERIAARPQASDCVLDPTEDFDQQTAAIAGAIEALHADIVVPNYGDLAFGAATLQRARSRGAGRVIAVAHTNDDFYREMLATHNAWDAAVGVSDACSAWLAPLAAGRPLATVACGVPTSVQPRSVDASVLRLAYVGRMVERQKRVSDLLVLLAELDGLGVRYELDVVGDGDAMADWQRRLDQRPPLGAVRVHGARPLEWVQRFWQRVDVNVIVSDAEGTSVSMLESMAHGVIPCITAVDSGATAIVRDNQNGIAVPVGDIAAMAKRLAALALDREQRVRFSAAARRTIRDKGLTIEACAIAWAELIHSVRRLPPAATLRSGPDQANGGTGVGARMQASGDPWDPGVQDVFSRLAADRERVAVWFGRALSVPISAWITAQHPRFAGFVRLGASDSSTYFGASCIPPSEADARRIDAIIVPDAENNLQGAVFAERLRSDGVSVEYVPEAPRMAARVREAWELCREMREAGARVVTTCDRGILGVPPLDLEGARPDLVILRGEEVDFDHFAAMRAWRRDGTMVRSLGFH